MNARTRFLCTALIRGTCLIVAGAVVLGGAEVARAGTTIGSFSELMGSNTPQIINNSPNYDFTVEGATPTLDYHFGFLNNGGYVVGYLDNSHPVIKDRLSGLYNGDPTPPVDADALAVGEKPVDAVCIEDTDADGIIGELSGGIFTVDAGDRWWGTNIIEFNGVEGGISEMPAYTGTSDTLTIPSINLVPEPGSIALMIFGAGIVGRKQLGGLVKRLFGKK